MLKWKVGATYLDTPNSLTQDDDYVDIITHELEFVPKKEVYILLLVSSLLLLSCRRFYY